MINKDVKYSAIYNSGAMTSLINYNFLRKWKIPISKFEDSKFKVVGGTGNVYGRVRIN